MSDSTDQDQKISKRFTQPQKMPRQRKPQSEEEFEAQKAQYAQGPRIHSDNWLLETDFSSADGKSKLDRMTVKNAAERAYFVRDYSKALQILEITERWQITDKERKEYDTIKEACLSAKVDP